MEIVYAEDLNFGEYEPKPGDWFIATKKGGRKRQLYWYSRLYSSKSGEYPIINMSNEITHTKLGRLKDIVPVRVSALIEERE